MNLFEKRIPFKKTPLWLSWLLISLIGFCIGEYFLFYYQEKHFWYLELFLGFSLCTWPIVFIFIARSFRSTMQILSPVFWKNSRDFEKWLYETEKRVFTLETWKSRLITFTIAILGPITFLILGLPLKNDLLNYSGLLAFAGLSFLGGFAAYFFLELLFVLIEIVKKPAKIPFFRLPHPAIDKLQAYYSFNALGMTIAYSTLAFGAWSSPYQLHPSLLLWLAILGLWPLATFSLSTFQVHILIQKVKQSHLDTINAQIQIMIENIETNKNTEDSYEKLDKAMGVQTKVQNISEWPFAFSSIITFIISTASAIIQLTFAIVNILNP